MFYYDIEGDIIDEYNIYILQSTANGKGYSKLYYNFIFHFNHSVVVNEKKIKNFFASICHIAYFFAKIVVKCL